MQSPLARIHNIKITKEASKNKKKIVVCRNGASIIHGLYNTNIPTLCSQLRKIAKGKNNTERKAEEKKMEKRKEKKNRNPNTKAHFYVLFYVYKNRLKYYSQILP